MSTAKNTCLLPAPAVPHFPRRSRPQEYLTQNNYVYLSFFLGELCIKLLAFCFCMALAEEAGHGYHRMTTLQQNFSSMYMTCWQLQVFLSWDEGITGGSEYNERNLVMINTWTFTSHYKCSIGKISTTPRGTTHTVFYVNNPSLF